MCVLVFRGLDNKKMSVGLPKRKKTAPLKSVEVKVSVPNPNIVSSIFPRSVTAAIFGIRWHRGPKAPLLAVPIDIESSGGVPVSASQPKGSNKTELSVLTGEVNSIVYIVCGGRKRLSVVPYKKQLFVSRLTPICRCADDHSGRLYISMHSYDIFT